MADERAATYNMLLQPNFDAYDLIDSLPDFVPKVTYPPTPGYRFGGAHEALTTHLEKAVQVAHGESVAPGKHQS